MFKTGQFGAPKKYRVTRTRLTFDFLGFTGFMVVVGTFDAIAGVVYGFFVRMTIIDGLFFDDRFAFNDLKLTPLLRWTTHFVVVVVVFDFLRAEIVIITNKEIKTKKKT